VFLNTDSNNIIINGTVGSASGNVTATVYHVGNITLASAGINTGGNANLSAPGNITLTGGDIIAGGNVKPHGGAISETGAGRISATRLTTTSVTGTVLQNGANTVSSFSATNTTSGDVRLPTPRRL